MEQPKARRPSPMLSDFLIIESDGTVQVPSRASSPLDNEHSLEDGFVVFESNEGTRFVFDGMEVREYYFDPQGTSESAVGSAHSTEVPDGSAFDPSTAQLDLEELEDALDSNEELLEELGLLGSKSASDMESAIFSTDVTSTSTEIPSTYSQQIHQLSPEFREFLFSLHMRNAPIPRPNSLLGIRSYGAHTLRYPFSYSFVRQMRPSQTAGEVDKSYYVPVQDDFGIEDIEPLSPSADQPSLFFVKRKNSPSNVPLLL